MQPTLQLVIARSSEQLDSLLTAASSARRIAAEPASSPSTRAWLDELSRVLENAYREAKAVAIRHGAGRDEIAVYLHRAVWGGRRDSSIDAV